MTAARSVVAAGYTPLDIVRFNGDEWRAAGGTASNVAAILSSFGWSSGLVADIGDDAAGRAVLVDLASAGVDTSHIRTREFDTARVVHEIGSKGHGYRFSCPTCGRRFPRSRPLTRERAIQIADEMDAPDVYFFDRANPGTVELARRFAKRGSFVAFEPSKSLNGRYVEDALSLVHLIKTADDRDVLDVETAEQAGRPRQIRVITHGVDGASFKIGHSKWRRLPSFSHPVVDAGGAGDWTTAGLLHALEDLRKPTIRTVGNALRWGQALAAVSCGAPGARGLSRQTASTILRAVDLISNETQQLLILPTPSIRKPSPQDSYLAVGCETCFWTPRDPAPPRRLSQLGVTSPNRRDLAR